MLNHQRLLIITLVVVLSACGAAGPVKPSLPESLPVRQYVPVPKELTKRCTWPKVAPLKDVIEAARKRKTCLLQYEGQLDGIEQLHP